MECSDDEIPIIEPYSRSQQAARTSGRSVRGIILENSPSTYSSPQTKFRNNGLMLPREEATKTIRAVQRVLHDSSVDDVKDSWKVRGNKSTLRSPNHESAHKTATNVEVNQINAHRRHPMKLNAVDIFTFLNDDNTQEEGTEQVEELRNDVTNAHKMSSSEGDAGDVSSAGEDERLDSGANQIIRKLSASRNKERQGKIVNEEVHSKMSSKQKKHTHEDSVDISPRKRGGNPNFPAKPSEDCAEVRGNVNIRFRSTRRVSKLPVSNNKAECSTTKQGQDKAKSSPVSKLPSSKVTSAEIVDKYLKSMSTLTRAEEDLSNKARGKKRKLYDSRDMMPELKSDNSPRRKSQSVQKRSVNVSTSTSVPKEGQQDVDRSPSKVFAATAGNSSSRRTIRRNVPEVESGELEEGIGAHSPTHKMTRQKGKASKSNGITVGGRSLSSVEHASPRRTGSARKEDTHTSDTDIISVDSEDTLMRCTVRKNSLRGVKTTNTPIKSQQIPPEIQKHKGRGGVEHLSTKPEEHISAYKMPHQYIKQSDMDELVKNILGNRLVKSSAQVADSSPSCRKLSRQVEKDNSDLSDMDTSVRSTVRIGGSSRTRRFTRQHVQKSYLDESDTDISGIDLNKSPGQAMRDSALVRTVQQKVRKDDTDDSEVDISTSPSIRNRASTLKRARSSRTSRGLVERNNSETLGMEITGAHSVKGNNQRESIQASRSVVFIDSDSDHALMRYVKKGKKLQGNKMSEGPTSHISKHDRSRLHKDALENENSPARSSLHNKRTPRKRVCKYDSDEWEVPTSGQSTKGRTPCREGRDVKVSTNSLSRSRRLLPCHSKDDSGTSEEEIHVTRSVRSRNKIPHHDRECESDVPVNRSAKRCLLPDQRTPRSTVPGTISTPKSGVRRQLLTPSMPIREISVRTPQTPLQEAMNRLHVSTVPHSLPCRETEFADVYRFVEGKILDESGGCMYISGVPGTGKTATVHEVMRSLHAAVTLGHLPCFQFAEVNAMRLTDPREAYVHILQALDDLRVSAKQAHQILEHRFTINDRRRKTTVLLMDELDALWTRRQDVVYNLLDWPTNAGSRLVVITIANTMDLPERLMKGRVSSRLGLTRVTFHPYTHRQLQQIVQARLAGIPAFEPDAIQFVARKVASVSGDARRALDICRRATEIAEQDGVEHNGGSGTVTMQHVDQALVEMMSSPKVQALMACSQLEHLFLRAVASELERTGMEETQFNKVYRLLTTLCTYEGVKVPPVTAAMKACSSLGSSRLLLTEHSQADGLQRILLNISSDDLHYALKGIEDAPT